MQKRIMLPEGVVKNVGEAVACPAECPFRKLARCSKKQDFVIAAIVKDVSADDPILKNAERYSDAELAQVWGIGALAEKQGAQAPIEEKKTPPQAPAANAQKQEDNPPAAEKKAQTPPESAPKSKAATASKYGSLFSNTPAAEPPKKEEYFEVDKNAYKFVNIGGTIFSLTRTRGHMPASDAINLIFRQGNYRFMFKDADKCDELSDRFCWLIAVTAKRRIKRKEIDDILKNSEYTPQQKFFYLFYDVIFKERAAEEIGFYWVEQFTLVENQSIFKTREDFANAYFNLGERGEDFRAFYQEHKKEILHYLCVEDEEEFLASCQLSFSEARGNITYTNSEGLIEEVGSISEVMRDMISPDVSFARKRQIERCLLKFRITRDGTLLERREPLSVYNSAGKKIDDRIYAALSLQASSSYRSEYNCFMTLLREYMRVFKPNSVTVGPLVFTKNNYSVENRKILCEFFEVLLAEDVNERERNEIIGRVWLAKELLEEGILGYNCENAEELNELFAFVSSGIETEAQKAAALRKYFDKFSADPCIRTSRGRIKIGEYVREQLRARDPYAVCEIVNGNIIIREYLDSKTGIGAGKEKMAELFSKLDTMYSNFKKN